MSALMDMERHQRRADVQMRAMRAVVHRMRLAMQGGDVARVRECSCELRLLHLNALTEAAQYETAAVADAHARRVLRQFDGKMVAAGDHWLREEVAP